MRSYSPHLGAMSTEHEMNRCGARSRIISFTRNSCRGCLNDQRKQTPIAATSCPTRRRIASSDSVSLSGTTTSPKQSTRSETPSMKRFGTIGTGFRLSGKCTTLRISREVTPREPRMMWMASSWPRVVIRPTRAPFLWRSVFVPTVVPCVRTATSRQNRSKETPKRPAARRIAASIPSAKSAGVDGDLVAVIRPLRSSATQSVKVPPMSTPTRRLGTDYFGLSGVRHSREGGNPVAFAAKTLGPGFRGDDELFSATVELESVVRVAVHLHAGTGRLHIAADHVQTVADHGARQAVSRHRQRRQHGPAVACRVVCLQRAEGVHHLRVLTFAAGDIDAPAVDARRHRAARGRHLGAGTSPGIGGRIVFLDDVDVAAARGDESAPDAPADHVDLAVDRACGRMIARSRHRGARPPRVCCRIVFFD